MLTNLIISLLKYIMDVLCTRSGVGKGLTGRALAVAGVRSLVCMHMTIVERILEDQSWPFLLSFQARVP